MRIQAILIGILLPNIATMAASVSVGYHIRLHSYINDGHRDTKVESITLSPHDHKHTHGGISQTSLNLNLIWGESDNGVLDRHPGGAEKVGIHDSE